MAGTLKWYGDELRLKFKKAERAMVDAAAFMVEGGVKGGAAVDTGFLRNSVYAITPSSNSYGPAAGAAMGVKSHSSQILAGPASPPADGAVVGVAARYALYAEARAPFIYPAVERVAGASEAQIVAAGRAVL